MNEKVSLRLATENDLDDLVRLEEAAFTIDRFSEDQIDYFLTRSRATIFVLEHGSAMAGAAYLLWRKSHRAARLYNIALHPTYQGRKYGERLLKECELEAGRRECRMMTLEVRQDNAGAIRFYEKHGFSVVGGLADYYEDGMAGLKMAKELRQKVPRQLRLNIPYHPQGLEFTCGQACMMMALKYFLPKTELTRTLELNLWREATLIFMASGFGGAEGYGLALSAVRRGLTCRLIVSMDTTPMLRSVRTAQKREVMRVVHNDMKRQAYKAGVTSAVFEYGIHEVTSALHRGLVPIAMVSTYRLTGDRVPHWVVVTGIDEKSVYIHDPDSDSYRRKKSRARHLRIDKAEFLRMSRYGKEVYRCLLLIGPSRGA